MLSFTSIGDETPKLIFGHRTVNIEPRTGLHVGLTSSFPWPSGYGAQEDGSVRRFTAQADQQTTAATTAAHAGSTAASD